MFRLTEEKQIMSNVMKPKAEAHNSAEWTKDSGVFDPYIQLSA